jgi:hypothetical protein
VETALNDLRFLVQRAEIDSELAALSRAADRGSLPDYSSISEVVQTADVPDTDKVDAKPVFMPISATSNVAPAEPIAQLLSAWGAPNDSRARDLQDQPALVDPDRPVMVPQVRPGLTPPPVFGKKEAPRATRSAPLANR